MSDRIVTIMLTKLECLHDTGEWSNHDEVYFKIWVDGNFKQTYPEGASNGQHFSMNPNKDSMRYCDLNLPLTYGSSVRFQLRETDDGNENHDETIGENTIYTSGLKLEGTKTYTSHFQGYKKAHYVLTWRLVSQKLPTIRIFSIYCQKSSSNCPDDMIQKICDKKVAEWKAASTILGATHIPQAEEIAKALDAAAMVMKMVPAIAHWIGEISEGADDVYIQHAQDGQQAHDWVSIFPTDSSQIEMNDGDTCHFQEKYGKYCRLPLDMGDVTIELRERDKADHDVSLGAMTVGMADFKANCGKGSIVQPLDMYLDPQKGQGCLYHICFAYAMEDWTVEPTWEDAAKYE